MGTFGCASPQERATQLGWRTVIEHIDATDSPCGERGPDAGCHAMINGTSHIWYSSVGPGYVRSHELAHARGMRHTDWQRHAIRRGLCAVVIIPTDGYPAGADICIDGRRELVLDNSVARNE